MKFRLPDRTQRVSIMGRTGSGKTQFAAWMLSLAPFNRQPYVIIDYKFDELLNDIPRIEELGVSSRIPKQPGLYIVHPLPSEESQVEDLLWRIWQHERTGVYIDEAHMLPNDGAFQSLLTQGRSKRIPMIVLTQRPAWVNRFVFSEADFYTVFHLNDRRDRKKVEEFVPKSQDEPLALYHATWYDVGQNALFLLKPVPKKDYILERFNDRMPRGWFAARPRPKRRD